VFVQVPTSYAGKIVGSAIMLAGILVLALPITVFGTNFTIEWSVLEEQRKEAAAVAAAGGDASTVDPRDELPELGWPDDHPPEDAKFARFMSAHRSSVDAVGVSGAPSLATPHGATLPLAATSTTESLALLHAEVARLSACVAALTTQLERVTSMHFDGPAPAPATVVSVLRGSPVAPMRSVLREPPRVGVGATPLRETPEDGDGTPVVALGNTRRK
jgi:hypothetical protein